MTATLENIKLKNTVAELQLKIKKLNEEIHRKTNEFSVNK